MTQKESARKSQELSKDGIDRRDLLLGLGATAAMMYTGTSNAAMSPHHDHSKHSAQMPDVLDAINKCLDKGQRCIAHCLVSFQEGDTELADCAAKAHEMQAICDGFSYLLASNSKHVKEYASVCLKVCKECEDECMKHKKHIECKACGEACAEVVDQIKLRVL